MMLRYLNTILVWDGCNLGELRVTNLDLSTNRQGARCSWFYAHQVELWDCVCLIPQP